MNKISKKDEELKKEKTRKLSIQEGAFSSVMSGIAEPFITPFALALQSTNFQIGLISAVSGLAGPLAQLKGSKLIEKNSRVNVIVRFVTLQAFIWLPILILGLFFMNNLFLKSLPILLIIFYALYAIFGSLAGPAYFSLMGDLVPKKIRGIYFGKRNRISTTIALIATFAASFILDFFKTKGYLLIGFSIIFLIAGISRFIASRIFDRHYEPSLTLPKEYYFSFTQFIKKAPKNNFGKFAIFVSLIYFSTLIAGPFFAVYMLSPSELGLGYKWFTLITVSSSIATLIFFPYWGKFSDKYGNKRLLVIGSIIISITPILWIFSPNPLYLVLVPNVLGGIGWAAFNLGASNFIYEAVTPERRAICVAYYNVLIGVGSFIGASLGGFITEYVPISFMNVFLFVFLLSGISRALASVIMLPKIKEVREVKKNENIFLNLRGLVPMRGLLFDIFHLGKNKS